MVLHQLVVLDQLVPALLALDDGLVAELFQAGDFRLEAGQLLEEDLVLAVAAVLVFAKRSHEHSQKV